MQNALYDPQAVQIYHNEYLKLINFYMNTKRPSTFVRYFNIDIDQSTYDDKLEATYDLYHVSNIKFNIYDFTPSYYLAPVLNAAANVPDLRGQMMDATSSIVVYSIESPRIHDLIMFYGPIKSGEIFKVTGIRTPVNAVHSDPTVRWFELELEYAPITTTQELKIISHFVYDLSDERYITYKDYQDFTVRIKRCEEIFDELIKYYDSYNDLYQFGQLAPVEVNETIIFFKKFYAIKYKRIYEKYNLPYGYLDKMNFTQMYTSAEDLPFVMGNYTYHVYNLLTNTIDDYTWSVTHTTAETDLDKMFLLTYQLLQEAFSWKI
jgi:hypothetical protein